MRAAAFAPRGLAAARRARRPDVHRGLGARVAGGLAGRRARRARPSSSRPTNFDAVLVFGFTAAVLGGLESPPGALVGGLLARARAELRVRLPRGRVVTLGALVILVATLMVRPNGLFAGRRGAAVSSLLRHARDRRRRRCVALSCSAALLSQFNNLQLATAAYLFVARRGAHRADRAQRADLARPRRADGRRRLHDGEAARATTGPAAAGARPASPRRSRARSPACSRAPPRRGCAGPYLAGATLALAVGLPGDRAALPGVPRRLQRADRRRRRSRPRRSGETFALERWQACIACLAALLAYVRAGQPRRAAGSGATSGPCATTRSPPSSPACTSRARRCSRSWSAPRARAWPAACWSWSRRSPRRGRSRSRCRVALLTGVILGGLGSLAGRGLGRRRAGA